MWDLDNCRELTKSFADVVTTPAFVDFTRYTSLHSEGQEHIRNWFEHSWNLRFNFEDVSHIQKPMQSWVKDDYSVQEQYKEAIKRSFEAFSFLWFAFNAWAACVTDKDRDRVYLYALMRNDSICQDFSRLTSDPDSPAGFYTRWFAGLWPIFDVKSLYRQGIYRFEAKERREVVEFYLGRGARRFEPQCWVRHKRSGEPIPVDWPHMLLALYKVRCNLFHGQKMLHSENDRLVVFTAFHTLLYFLRSANYFDLKESFSDV